MNILHNCRLGALVLALGLTAAPMAVAQKKLMVKPEATVLSQLKNKTPLLILAEYNTRTLKELQQKPEEKARYMKAVDFFNASMQQAAEDYLDLGKGRMEVMKQGAALNLLKSTKGNKYVAITFEMPKGAEPDPAKMSQMYGDESVSYDNRKSVIGKENSTLNLAMTDYSKQLSTVFSIPLPAVYPSYGDFAFGFQEMSHMIENWQKKRDYEVLEFKTEVDANRKVLGRRTVLLDNALLASPDAAESVKAGYKGGNMEVVDFTVIEEKLRNRDTNYAYVVVIPMSESGRSAGVSIIHAVVDIKDGKVIGRYKTNRMIYNDVARDVTRKEVENYATY